MLSGQGEGTGWRQHRESAIGADMSQAGRDYCFKNAILWGGNLSLLVSLLGSPYFPQIKGGILFLEDVGEHPYRIERLLTQLLNAGVLGQQKAILMGQFTEFKLTPHDKGFNLKSVFQWLKSQTKTPVFTNLPFGHVATKVLLPVGAKTELVVEGRDALLFWGHMG
jgi:muramoyltetrapeptide carboxypeptidase